MKIAVTGFPGGLVRDKLVAKGIQPIDADILDVDALYGSVQNIFPDVVIHAAAMTDVDKCETDYKKAFQVNVRGTMNVVEACNTVGARIVYLSSCHVFDGETISPYSETYRTNPKNNYGFMKWEGEVLVHSLATKFLIVRISKLFSSEMCKKYLDKPEEVVRPTFMVRNYTHASDFCNWLLDVIYKPLYNNKFLLNLGVYDVTSSYLFWKMLYGYLGIDEGLVIPREVEDKSYVFRPKNGSLDMGLALRSGVKLGNMLDGFMTMRRELGI